MNNKTHHKITFLDIAIFAVAFILFTKTADVLGIFAPQNVSNFFGFNVSDYYGYANAVIVEGLAITLYYNERANKIVSAQIVKYILVGISAACQIFDGQVTANAVASLTPQVKTLFTVGIPLIPLAIFVMLIWIGPMFAEDTVTASKPWKGIVPMFSGKLDAFLYGPNGKPRNVPNVRQPEMNMNNQKVDAPELEKVNPTERRNGSN